MRIRVLGGLLAALTAILLAGCSSTPAAPPAGDHNAADVAFAQGMLPHHRQAVAMTALAAGRTTTPEVRDLAAEIERAQDPEIETMTGMLARWGAPAPDPAGMAGMSMPGMMSGDAMARLAALSGPAFDRAFLEMMIEHHTGAVQMAATETAQGRDPAALDLARSISASQQDEIGRMRALLARP